MTENAPMPRHYVPLDVSALIASLEAVPLRRSQIARETGLSRTTITLLATGERGRCPEYRTVAALQRVHAKHTRKV